MASRDRLSNADSQFRGSPWLSTKLLQIGSLLVAICVFPWTGCSRRPPSPDRAELIKVLGPIDDNVLILGGRSRLSTSSSSEPALAGKLWFVKSKAPLPQRFPSSDVASNRQPNDRTDANTSFSKSTFPVRAAYDLAAALKIDEKELELPLGGSIETVQGRLSEWRVGNSQVRIRDFQTPNGWLAVVEAFFNLP